MDVQPVAAYHRDCAAFATGNRGIVGGLGSLRGDQFDIGFHGYPRSDLILQCELLA